MSFGGYIKLDGADEYKRNLREINGELKLTAKEMEVHGKSIEGVSKQIDLHNKKIEEQKKWIESIESALEKENSAAEKNVKKIAELENMLRSAKTTLLDMEKGLKDAKDGLESLSDKADAAAGKLAQAGDVISGLGDKAAKFSATMAATAAASGKLAMDFDSSFAKVSTLISDSDIDMQALADDTLKLSGNVNVSAREMNEAFYSALSAGVEITSDYGDTLDFLEKNAKLAAAGFTDMQTSIDATTTVLNAYGMELDETNRVHETLINTQNLGKTTVGALGASLSQVAPTAAALGVDIEQVGAAFAAMTAQGVPTAQAATQIRSALAELSKEGQQAYDNFERISGQSFKNFIAGGGTLSEAMRLMAEDAKASGAEVNSLFGSVEAANTALILAGDTGFTAFNKSLETMRSSAGAVNTAFGQVSDTAAYKAAKALNDIKNAGIELGQALLPVVEDFSGNISKFAQWFSELDEGTQKAIAGFVAAGAAAAPLLKIVGEAVSGLSGLIKVVDKLKGAMGLLAAVNPEILALVAVIGGLVAVLTALNAVFLALNATVDEGHPILREFGEEVRKQADTYEQAKKSIDDKAKSQQDELAVIQQMLPRLEELSKKTSRTAEEDEELHRMIEQLNTKFPDLGLAIDETTGKLNMQVTAIDDLIEAQKREIIVAQQFEKMQAAIKNSMSAEETLQSTESGVTAAYQNLTAEEKRIVDGIYKDYLSGKYYPTKIDQAIAAANVSLPELDQIEKRGNVAAFRAALQAAQVAQSNKGRADTDVQNAESEYRKALAQGGGEKKSDRTQPAPTAASGNDGSVKPRKPDLTKEEEEKVKQGLDVWKYRRDRGIITEQEYYKELARIRDQYYNEDSAQWRKLDLEIYNWQVKTGQDAEKERAKAADAAEKQRVKATQEAAKAREAADKEAAKAAAAAEAERAKAAEDAYKKQQAASYDWISERVYRGDFADFGTDEDASYERIYQRALDAFNNGVIDVDALAGEADKITAAKLADYKTKKEKISTFIDERNFYGDWDKYNVTEKEMLEKSLELADEYYAKQILGYKEYAEEVNELNRKLYTQNAREQESIMKAAQTRIQNRLDAKKKEMDSQIEALNKQVSDLKAQYTTQDRRKRMGELQEEIKDYRHAVTLEGQEHLKSLQEEAERLRREQEIENLQKHNNEIIEQLQAEYAAMETEKLSLIAKIAENTEAGKIQGMFEGFVQGLQNKLIETSAAAITRVMQNNTNINNNNTVTQNITAPQKTDLLAALGTVLRGLK